MISSGYTPAMFRSFFIGLLAFSLILAGCTQKKTQPKTDFDVPSSPSDAFENLISALENENLEISTLDTETRTVKTVTRDVKPQQLTDIAALSENYHQYEHGRFNIEAQVTPTETGSHIHLQVNIEGQYSGKQRSSKTGGKPVWRKESSNGSYETRLTTAIRNM